MWNENTTSLLDIRPNDSAHANDCQDGAQIKEISDEASLQAINATKQTISSEEEAFVSGVIHHDTL